MKYDERVLDILRNVIDPEVGINIVDLGLVYEASYENGHVHVLMTMTTPACPMGSYITETAEEALRQTFGDATPIDIMLVWDPPWTPDMMTPKAKEQLGWDPDGSLW